MSTTHIDTAVIGAGPAGLVTARLLAAHGIEPEIFDAHARVGDPWRERYRSLRLFTPGRWVALPGMPLECGRFGYPTGDEMADYLERYAQRFALSVHAGRTVSRLTRNGAFTLEFSGGDRVTADRVVVATGAHQRPITPPVAERLDPAIGQLHSLDYRGPEDLAPGAVLVVGAGNSGTDIALEAAASGHPTTIAGRHPGQVSPDIDSPLGNLMVGLFLRRLRATTLDTRRGRAAHAAQQGHGVNLVRNKLRDLERAGITRVGRIAQVRDGMPACDGGPAIAAATVVWCTGSLPQLDWIDLPGVLTPAGMVRHTRGLVDGVPGLGFVGLPFQYSPLSAAVVGMRPDAAHVVERLVAHAPTSRTATAQRATAAG